MSLQWSSSSDWTISDPSGGSFLTVFDPVFSADEQHLLLATRQCLNVYAISSSLLIRSICPLGGIAFVVLSQIDGDLVYIADEEGNITLWNWKDGEQESFTYSVKADSSGPPVSILGISVAAVSGRESIFLACSERNEQLELKSSIISFMREAGVDTQDGKEIKTLLEQVRSIQTLDGVIFVATKNSIDIGTAIGNKRKREDEANGIGHNYNWRRLNFNEEIFSFDVRMHSPNAKSNQFDMVIGNRVGEISVFEDVLHTQFECMPQPYHWHRSQVNSLKWSLDGNRIISGGGETVLLIFTRSTGRKDTIPHLTAGIVRISVSPSGKLYALHLGNNSVLVFSTSDYQAVAAVTGLQTPLVPRRLPAVAHPQLHGQVLFAVPANSTPQLATGQSPFLQTFNVTNGRHIARHALARANVTNVNIAPQGGDKLKESDVKLLQISNDGEWLVTVNEWTPPASDLRYIGMGDAREQKARREVELKFWRWEPKLSGGAWQLETKVLRPHHHDMILPANRVLGLVASPTKMEFATVGEDAIVRVWKLKKYSRSNVAKKEIYTWILSKQIVLESKLNVSAAEWTERLIPSDGRLAYSNDGSTLAAALDYDSKDAETWMSVDIIDVKAGEVVRMVQGLFTASTLAAMKFLGRFLILVSTLVRVHNLVKDQVLYDYVFEDWKTYKSLRPEQKHAIRDLRHLEINTRSNTFAVSSVDPNKSAEVMVFGLDSNQPIFKVQIPTAVSALLSLPASFGYLAIDAAAEYHIVRPKGEMMAVDDGIFAFTKNQTANGRANDVDTMELFDDSHVRAQVENSDESESGGEDDEDHYRPPVTEEVIELLEQMRLGGGFTNPSDLLAEVAKLYIGKKPGKTGTKAPGE